MTTRRQFLTRVAGGGAILSIGSLAPGFWVEALAAQPAANNENILVVVQLTGGNDGLNTIVPFRNEEYYKQRKTLAVARDSVVKINEEAGFHPAAVPLSKLLEAGKLAVVQGVGYPQPNRSHFESMDIWHTCQRKSEARKTGWLGRYLDANKAGESIDVPAIHLGHEKQPFALAANDVRVPSIASIDRFRLQGSQADLVREINTLEQASPAGGDLLSFVQSSTSAALSASQRIEQASRDYRTTVRYPEDPLAQQLKVVAQLIDAGLRTRVYYLSLDGFDTHSQQAAAHEGLLRRWSGALDAFLADLEAHGHADRALVLSFSEFGRRVAENASAGTDHGAAAPVFLAGNRVKAGLHGAHPSLTDLDDGDLKHHTDFRQVYATLLDSWLGVDSRAVIGGEYRPLELI